MGMIDWKNPVEVREYYRAKLQRWRSINQKKSREQKRRWRKKYPEKIRAVNIANRKIKIPKGEKCTMCKKRLATDKHHPDYSKPLKVIFLCRKCHNGVHRNG